MLNKLKKLIKFYLIVIFIIMIISYIAIFLYGGNSDEENTQDIPDTQTIIAMLREEVDKKKHANVFTKDDNITKEQSFELMSYIILRYYDEDIYVDPSDFVKHWYCSKSSDNYTGKLIWTCSTYEERRGEKFKTWGTIEWSGKKGDEYEIKGLIYSQDNRIDHRQNFIVYPE